MGMIISKVSSPKFQSFNLTLWNAVFINEGIPQAERLAKLNAIAISQMKVLTEDHRLLQLNEVNETES